MPRLQACNPPDIAASQTAALLYKLLKDSFTFYKPGLLNLLFRTPPLCCIEWCMDASYAIQDTLTHWKVRWIIFCNSRIQRKVSCQFPDRGPRGRGRFCRSVGPSWPRPSQRAQSEDYIRGLAVNSLFYVGSSHTTWRLQASFASLQGGHAQLLV